MNALLQLSANRDRVKPTVSLAVAAAIVLYALLGIRAKKKQHGLKELPLAPYRFPIVGHILSLGKEPIKRFKTWHEQLGPIFRLYMGQREWIMVEDPKIAHDLFVQRGPIMSSRAFHRFSYTYYGHNGRGIVMGPGGKRWKDSRTAALFVLAPKIVERFDWLIESEAEHMVNELFAATQAKGAINPGHVFPLSSMNVILTLCFATRVSTTEDPLYKTFLELAEKTFVYASVIGDVGVFMPIFKWTDYFTKMEKTLYNFVNKYRDIPVKKLISDALAGDQDCLVKTLYEVKDKYEMDDTDILVLLSDLIIAGADTTAVTLSWAVAILTHHPEVQQKIQAEIDAFMATHDRYPTFDDRDEFPYMISVQKECMRLRPTTYFGIPHTATETFEYKGYIIRKGASVISNMHSMHKNPSVYPEPEKFIPDRFINNTKSMLAAANGTLEDRDHYNFGWGRRICPGIHLAEIELFHTFIRLFAKYSIEPIQDENGNPIYPDLEVVKRSGVVVVTPEDYKVQVVPRKNK